MESDEFEKKDSDSSDVAITKDSLNKIQKHLSDYKSGKGKVDSLFKNDGEVSEDDIIKIIGKEDDRNEFLEDYVNIVSMEKKLNNLKNSEDRKNAELSNMKLRLDNANDETKNNIQNSLDNLNISIDEIKSKIEEINKNLPEMEKKHSEKMKEIEKNIHDWIEKISISDQSDKDGDMTNPDDLPENT